ncbi:acyltransferase family protein [Xanthobacter sp. V3C-3]|uniref:acyltransferase family protein n=1 Tax=Xanthobacter lutulentifluminis TaxID=3119935 RepID=UPI00372BDA34
MKYRSDISGLRALAVVPVVLFHADPRLMPGGYVGVDVFFVISGYLITSVIAEEMRSGHFSLLRFYDRRVRRILPAYVLVALATLVAALVLYPPGMLEAYGRSLSAASTFLANRHFLATTVYFAPSPYEHLLLHTWSLAIEEQFYLFWPLLLVALFHPRLAKARGFVLLALALVSLWLATKNAIDRPERAFYNFSGRAFELLIGAMLALGHAPRISSQRAAEMCAGLGVALILVACLLFTEQTIFPGATALVPTLGAALVLVAGEEGRRTFAGRLLSLPPLAFTGLISYSLYLWHWPVFSLYRLFVDADPGPVQLVLVTAGIYALSAASWRYVEAPFRRTRPSTKGEEARTVAAGVAALVLLFGAGSALAALHGLPGRASPEALAAEAALKQRWAGGPRCLLGPNRFEPVSGCRFGDTASGAPAVALFGDSFANHHMVTLDAVAKEAGLGLVQLTKAGCAPGVPEPPRALATAEARACNRFRAAALDSILADPSIRAVVMAGNWVQMADPAGAMPGVKAAVERILASGRAVVLVTPPVIFANGGGRCVMRRRFVGLPDDGCAVPAAPSPAAATVEGALTAMAQGATRVRLVSVRPTQCGPDLCRAAIDGAIALVDSGHLSFAGSRALTGDFRAAFAALGLMSAAGN